NKPKAKDVLKAAGIAVPDGLLTDRFTAARSHAMTPPYVVKPPNEGSSLGVLIVKEDAAHPPQELFSAEWPYGDTVMIERYVAGRELTCAVIGNEPTDVIEIVTGERWYDYDAKYRPGGSRHVLPAQISPNIYQKVRMLALEAHRALGCRGVSR